MPNFQLNNTWPQLLQTSSFSAWKLSSRLEHGTPRWWLSFFAEQYCLHRLLQTSLPCARIKLQKPSGAGRFSVVMGSNSFLVNFQTHCSGSKQFPFNCCTWWMACSWAAASTGLMEAAVTHLFLSVIVVGYFITIKGNRKFVTGSCYFLCMYIFLYFEVRSFGEGLKKFRLALNE